MIEFYYILLGFILGYGIRDIALQLAYRFGIIEYKGLKQNENR